MNPIYNQNTTLTVCENEIINLPDGSSYTVTADYQHQSLFTSQYGCDSIITTNIVMIPTPSVDAGADQTICEGESILLIASGTPSLVWDNGVSNGVSFVPSSSNTYHVIGTDANGCTGTDEVTITLAPMPAIDVIVDNTLGCAPLTVTLTNPYGTLNNTVWTLSNGATLTGDNVQLTFNDAGNYSVSLSSTNETGCTSTQTYTDLISITPQPTASFYTNPQEVTTILNNVALNNTSSNANHYLWTLPDGTTSTQEDLSYSFQDGISGDYVIELIAMNDYGCSDTVYKTINVIEELIFYIPNTFTPDQDEYNQVFKPVFTSGYDPYDYTLLIFDRWGEIIFESHNTEIGWDGTYGASNPHNVQMGTFTWKIEFKTTNTDERKMFLGHVNLIK